MYACVHGFHLYVDTRSVTQLTAEFWDFYRKMSGKTFHFNYLIVSVSSYLNPKQAQFLYIALILSVDNVMISEDVSQLLPFHMLFQRVSTNSNQLCCGPPVRGQVCAYIPDIHTD